MVTQRHTQRLIKWLLAENWVHKQQNHTPFSDAQLFKLEKNVLALHASPSPCGRYVPVGILASSQPEQGLVHGTG